MKKDKISKQVKSKVEKAQRLIQDAKRSGAGVKTASEMFSSAEKCIKKGDGQGALDFVVKIKTEIKLAKGKRRYEVMINNTLPTIDKAKKVGVDVKAAEEELDRAREAIDEGLFGEAHEHIKKARRMAEDSKRYLTTKEQILRTAKLIDNAKRLGVDISEVAKILMSSWDALEQRDYGIVKSLIKDAKAAINYATEHKNFVDSVREVEARISAMRQGKIDTADLELVLNDAKDALDKKNYETVRKCVNKIKREIEKTVLQREAGLTIRTIEQFVKEAKKSGLKAQELDNLLEKASVALEAGDFSEIQAIELNAKQAIKNLNLFDTLGAGDITTMDRERKESFISWIEQEIIDYKEVLDSAREGDIDTSEIDELISTAESAMAETNYEGAFNAVQSIQGLFGDKGTYQAVAIEKNIKNATGMLEEARGLGVDVSEANDILDKARESLDKGEMDEIDSLVSEAINAIENVSKSHLEGKYPKLGIHMDTEGCEAERWNKCSVTVSNTGHNIAKDIDLSFFGNAEVRGWNKIPKLMPGESDEHEIALKSQNIGTVPLEITATYQRSFDNTKYQLNDLMDIEIEDAGTFIVEDVFLIYNSGGLIARESRRIKEEVDSDVFSAMFTAISDFVKESFSLPKSVGLSRVEIGENKVLVERGNKFFLAVTVLGDESVYIPFYMAEIIKEIQDKYGDILEDWTGEITQLEGIDEIIRKLLLIKADEITSTVEMRDSIITPVVDALKDGVQIPDLEDQLIERLHNFENQFSEDYSMKLLQENIDGIKSIVDEQLKGLNLQTEDRGMDQMLRESINVEIQSLREATSGMRAKGIETNKEDGLLERITSAFDAGEFDRTRRIIEETKKSVREKLQSSTRERYSDELGAFEEKVSIASEMGMDVTRLKDMVNEVKQVMEKGQVDDVHGSIQEINKTFTDITKAHMEDKFPRLQVSVIKPTGYQESGWNRFAVAVTNTGNTPARNIDLNFSKNVEVKNQEIISNIGANETKNIELAIKPLGSGRLPLEVTATYQRHFDDVKYQLNDLQEIDVDKPGSYIVEDVFLIHKTAVLISHETRRLQTELDSDIFSAMLTAITEFVGEAFKLSSSSAGLNRMEFSDSKVLIERGQHVYLALAISGDESIYMPFYMTEVINELEKKYESVLPDWMGEMDLLEGIDEIIQKLIFVKKDAETGVQTMDASLLSPALTAFIEGESQGEEISELEIKLEEVNEVISSDGFQAVQNFLPEIKEIVGKFSTLPTGADISVSMTDNELKNKIHNLMLRTGQVDGDSALVDQRLNTYLEEITKLSIVVDNIRKENNLSQKLPKVVIKHPDFDRWNEVIVNMKTLLLDQLDVLDVQLVEPDQDWDGLDINVHINEDMVREKYKYIATKVVWTLQNMPPEKIKENIKKEYFTIGIEGQQVYISNDIISVELSVPDDIIEANFEAGTIYVEVLMDEEAQAEMLMQKISEKISSMRDELELTEESYIEVQIFTTDELAEEIDKKKYLITANTNAYSVEVPIDDPFKGDDYLVAEIEYDNEIIKIGIVPVEFEDE